MRKKILFPHRLALRLTGKQREALDLMFGYKDNYDVSDLVRLAIDRLWEEYQVEKASDGHIMRGLFSVAELEVASAEALAEVPAAFAPPPEAEEPSPAPPEVKKETSTVKRKSTRRAPGPKTGDNHQPKKGTSNARTPDGRKRPPGRREARATKGRPRRPADGSV